MYEHDATRIPRDENDLWEILDYQFGFVLHILWHMPVQSREDALSGVAPGFSVIRYRGTSAEFDNRDKFLRKARKLLPYIHQCIDERTLTPEFVQQWGKLMYYHGYIASYCFDDSDDLAHQRAGFHTGKKRSKEGQRNWIARIVVPLVDQGLTRSAAEDEVVKRIKELISSRKFPEGYGQSWYESMLTRGGLASTYDEKHFSVKRMRELVRNPTAACPDVDL